MKNGDYARSLENLMAEMDKNRKQETVRMLSYTSGGAILGGLFSEAIGMTAVGWLGGICGGMAALPFSLAGGAVLGLAVLGVRLSLRK